MAKKARLSSKKAMNSHHFTVISFEDENCLSATFLQNPSWSLPVDGRHLPYINVKNLFYFLTAAIGADRPRSRLPLVRAKWGFGNFSQIFRNSRPVISQTASVRAGCYFSQRNI
jgi:hypothetical protein